MLNVQNLLTAYNASNAKRAVTCEQARYKLGTPRGEKRFLRGAQLFYTMSKTFFQWGAKIFLGGLCPPAPPLVTDLHAKHADTSLTVKRFSDSTVAR